MIIGDTRSDKNNNKADYCVYYEKSDYKEKKKEITSHYTVPRNQKKKEERPQIF